MYRFEKTRPQVSTGHQENGDAVGNINGYFFNLCIKNSDWIRRFTLRLAPEKHQCSINADLTIGGTQLPKEKLIQYRMEPLSKCSGDQPAGEDAEVSDESVNEMNQWK